MVPWEKSGFPVRAWGRETGKWNCSGDSEPVGAAAGCWVMGGQGKEGNKGEDTWVLTKVQYLTQEHPGTVLR